MKLKIISAALLVICFGWLALLSGAIPVMAKGNASSDAVSGETEPAQAEEPDEFGEPALSPEPEPDAEVALPPDETPEELPEPTPSPEPSLIPLTLTGDILDNDTYYDVDPQALLAEGAHIRLPAQGYQILILHTHATEAYNPEGEDIYTPSDGDDYRTTDPEYSVIRVGEALADALSQYGLSVLHDTALHDYPSYSGSYVRSGEAIEEYLDAYPGIRIVIDLHRDAIGEGDTIYKTIADIDGVEAAQLMFVMGSDVNLDHPNWQENLALALTLQAAVDARYPTLMRPVELCDYRYNQQLTPGSLLLEVGTSGNSLQEALAAVRLFAEITGPLLASWVEE